MSIGFILKDEKVLEISNVNIHNAAELSRMLKMITFMPIWFLLLILKVYMSKLSPSQGACSWSYTHLNFPPVLFFIQGWKTRGIEGSLCKIRTPSVAEPFFHLVETVP